MSQFDLIDRDAPNYASSTFPEPRAFQVSAHDKLRQGARDGHKNQLIMAPTGAGKSYLGMRICHEALLRGKRALFVCDRTTLINQTSAVADQYGLSAHGIIQASHWRVDLSLPFQIASCQTLAIWKGRDRSTRQWLAWMMPCAERPYWSATALVWLMSVVRSHTNRARLPRSNASWQIRMPR